MFKKIALATALIAGLGNAYAYQAEVGLNYNYIDIDNYGSENTFGVDGTYYFNPVEVKNNPLNEAAFLNHSSNVGAYYQGGDDLNLYGAKVEYFVPNSSFYGSASIGQIDVDDVDDNDKITTYTAEIGYLPIPSLLLAVGLVGYDTDYSDDVDPSIRAKYVTNLNGNAINLEAAGSFGDTDYYQIAGDFYVDPTLSLGASWGKSNPLQDPYSAAIAGSDDEVFSIRAKKFFTQQISLEGNIGFGDDANIYGVRGAYRF